MSDDYTPSTDEVREAWRDEMFPNASDAAFERWLAAHDATVRADHEKAVRERIAQVIENYATSDFQTRRLAYEQAARLARGEGA